MLGHWWGGVAHNVIAPSAQVDWEMRPVQQGDAEFVKDSLRRYCEDELLPKMRAVHPGAFITTDTIGEVVGLIPTDENEARKIVSELTGARQLRRGGIRDGGRVVSGHGHRCCGLWSWFD